MANEKPYITKKGLQIVKLTTHRFGVHNPGEVAGFMPDIAEKLIEKGFATNYTPANARPVALDPQTSNVSKKSDR